MQISKDLMKYAFAGILLFMVAGMACAGTGGSEFESVYDTLVEWTQGTLGRIISITTVLVGLVAGVVRQSIMAAVIGIASGMALYNANTVIEAIMTASVVSADKAALVIQLGNGLI